MIIKNSDVISSKTKEVIDKRQLFIAKTINCRFWDSPSKNDFCFFAGSYGRGTAENTDDIDILVELPLSERQKLGDCDAKGKSYLLGIIEATIKDAYPESDLSSNGQFVVIDFKDGIKFELIPAVKIENPQTGNEEYIYPYSNKGKWLSINPKAEIKAMDEKDSYSFSNGLLKDTCRQIRRIRNYLLSSYHLSGILIDSFVYQAMGDWHWLRSNEIYGNHSGPCEGVLLDYYRSITSNGICTSSIYAPGSGMVVDTSDWETLGKALEIMAQ